MFSRRIPSRAQPQGDPHHRHHRHHHHHQHKSLGRHDEVPAWHISDAELTTAQRPQKTQNNLTVIELVDIDATITRRPSTKIHNNESTNIAYVDRWLRWRFRNWTDGIKVPSKARIEFFNKQKKLSGDETLHDVFMLWYRVLDPTDDGLIKVTCKNTRLCQSDIDTLTRDVELGVTVGELRRKVASFQWVNTIEPDRIVIMAVGGARPGPLQGDNWECKKVKGWLCRYLAIGIVEPQNYFVFSGFNERYVLQGMPRPNDKEAVYVYAIKSRLGAQILGNVSQTSDDLEYVSRKDIILYHRGRPVRDGSRFPPGQYFDFELSRDAEDKFLQSKAWLLPLTEMCNICTEAKPVSEMPTQGRITSGCQHHASTCNDCVKKWITAGMETLAWDRLKCPECPEPLGVNDVLRYATKDAFDRYERQATRAALGGIEGFRWCLNPKCGAGEIFPSHCCHVAVCHACSHATCMHHNVPWHRGETCRQYDQRTDMDRKNNELSENTIRAIAKTCPDCNRKIQKHDGCDHITCVCGSEWCWLCTGPYTFDVEGFLHCQHTRECLYFRHQPFWEGPEAMLPFMADHDRVGGRRRPPAHVHWVEEGVVFQDAHADEAWAAWAEQREEHRVVEPTREMIEHIFDHLEV